MSRVREAVRPYPLPALFALAREGYTSVFEQLVACIISTRTRDEVTKPVSRELFRRARTPLEVRRLSIEDIDELIQRSTFHEAKARQIHEIAIRSVEEHGGELPCDYDVLVSFAGVGPKCANLVLGIVCGQPRIAVDVHVHRVVNRWGYVRARTPEQTLAGLEGRLPDRYAIEINRVLIPFGKRICTSQLPRCSTCPVLAWCRQVDVTAHR